MSHKADGAKFGQLGPYHRIFKLLLHLAGLGVLGHFLEKPPHVLPNFSDFFGLHRGLCPLLICHLQLPHALVCLVKTAPGIVVVWVKLEDLSIHLVGIFPLLCDGQNLPLPKVPFQKFRVRRNTQFSVLHRQNHLAHFGVARRSIRVHSTEERRILGVVLDRLIVLGNRLGKFILLIQIVTPRLASLSFEWIVLLLLEKQRLRLERCVLRLEILGAPILVQSHLTRCDGFVKTREGGQGLPATIVTLRNQLVPGISSLA
mmetsp:Transcript_15381/g.39654  ORF Transcript_15381/g.39654 Transcript_15381/m.39654 type:complete len:259 (-) Transcript_15381:1470-2246(-)